MCILQHVFGCVRAYIILLQVIMSEKDRSRGGETKGNRETERARELCIPKYQNCKYSLSPSSHDASRTCTVHHTYLENHDKLTGFFGRTLALFP